MCNVYTRYLQFYWFLCQSRAIYYSLLSRHWWKDFCPLSSTSGEIKNMLSSRGGWLAGRGSSICARCHVIYCTGKQRKSHPASHGGGGVTYTVCTARLARTISAGNSSQAFPGDFNIETSRDRVQLWMLPSIPPPKAQRGLIIFLRG